MQPDETMRRSLFERANANCECRLPLCAHQRQRCDSSLLWEEYGQGWNLPNMNLTEDTTDPLNWLVLCTHCLQSWSIASV